MQNQSEIAASNEPMDSQGVLTDSLARGFVAEVEPLRYGGFMLDEFEAFAFAIRSIPIQSRVLDVGCGGGDLGAYLTQHRQCTVTGLEPNPQRAEQACKQGFQVHAGYLDEAFCKQNGPYDSILFMDVLEHVVDPVALLILARQLLTPQGRIIISVPNVAHWTVRVNLLRGRFDYDSSGIMDATHLRWFTAKTVRKVVETAGCSVTDQDVSRGSWMWCYRSISPFRFLSEGRRRKLLDRLCRLFPGVFGCQHVLCAGR